MKAAGLAMKREWPVLAALALAVLLFASTFGLGLIREDAPAWQAPAGDMPTMLAGYYAVVDSPWRFPPTVTRRLIAPKQVSIVYSDSIPWLTLALKATGLGHAVNPLGLYLALSYLLQAIGMIALLRSCGVRRGGVLFLGAALALLFPAWLVRQFGHIALGGHWPILFALALAVASARSGLTTRRGLWFAALGALVMGLHLYLLIPVSACLAAALLAEVTERRPGAWRRVVIWGGAFAVSVVLAAMLLGYGYGRGNSGGAASLGVYSMNLMGPFLPQASALFGQSFDKAWFTGTIDPTGGQKFEGYNYLGAGILLMLLAALISLIPFRRGAAAIHASSPPSESAAKFLPLILALAALTLMAIGPRAYLGLHQVYALPLPQGEAANWLGFLRAHGRFFWAPGYMILAWALARLDRRAPSPVLITVGVAALALQAFDVSALRDAVHRRLTQAEGPYFPPSLPAARLKGWSFRFYPTVSCDPTVPIYQPGAQISLLAIRKGGDSNATPLARTQNVDCRPPPDLTRNALPGDERVTVVLGLDARAAEPPPVVAARTDCYRFTYGRLCGHGLAGVPGLIP